MLMINRIAGACGAGRQSLRFISVIPDEVYDAYDLRPSTVAIPHRYPGLRGSVLGPAQTNPRPAQYHTRPVVAASASDPVP